MPYILINQKIISEKEAKISVHERGFLFGDGIFETCKIYFGKIYNFKAHEQRIKNGLGALKIKAEINNIEKLSLKLVKKNKINHGILRISISRGIGSLGYLPTYKSKSLIVISTSKLPKRKKEKIIIGIGSLIKPSNKSSSDNCKTKQSLTYVLNKIEAQEKGFFDNVILSDHKVICETSAANIFWIKDKKIYTPSAECSCVLGTMRKKLLEISPIKIIETKKKIEALQNADEIFLTNATSLITAVDEFVFFDGKNKKIKKLDKKISNQLSKTLIADLSLLKLKRKSKNLI
jgi:branched-chain amino acid aminotransferase